MGQVMKPALFRLEGPEENIFCAGYFFLQDGNLLEQMSSIVSER